MAMKVVVTCPTTYISLAERGREKLSEAVAPGAFLVDVFPLRELHCGTGLEIYAEHSGTCSEVYSGVVTRSWVPEGCQRRC